MIVLSHRGYWQQPEEKNLRVAFERSFKLGFGTETDIRDCGGQLMISHDMPTGEEMTVEELLTIHSQYSGHLPLALNIKADGLQERLKALLAKFPKVEYFYFDMSVPDTLGYLKANLPFYIRLSEYETDTTLLAQAQGIWLDAFLGEWYSKAQLCEWLELTKVCIVSPDLHKRPYKEFWQRLREWGVDIHPNLMICTDFPEEAQQVFND